MFLSVLAVALPTGRSCSPVTVGHDCAVDVPYGYFGFNLWSDSDFSDDEAVDLVLTHLHNHWHAHIGIKSLALHVACMTNHDRRCHCGALADRTETARHICGPVILGMRHTTPVDLISAMGAILP